MVYQSCLTRSKQKAGVLAQFFDAGKSFSQEEEEEDDLMSIEATDHGALQPCANAFPLSKFDQNIQGMIDEGSIAALVSLGKNDDDTICMLVAGASKHYGHVFRVFENN